MSEADRRAEQERQQLATSVGQMIALAPKDEEERRVVEDLAQILVVDASALVRAALAREIRNCAAVPVDLAERIARDIEEIAIPFIELSPVLGEEFLANLARECSESIRVAVAGRPQLAERVTYAISSYGGEPSIRRFLKNQDAKCSNRVYMSVLDRFKDSERLRDGVMMREDLTLMIIDKLIDEISVVASEKLVIRYGLAPDLAGYLRGQARRKALQKAMRGASESEIDAYLRQHHLKGNIGPDLLSQFLEAGLPDLFRQALALSIGDTPEKVGAGLKEGGAPALVSFLRQTSFPKETFSMVVAGFVEHYSTASGQSGDRLH